MVKHFGLSVITAENENFQKNYKQCKPLYAAKEQLRLLILRIHVNTYVITFASSNFFPIKENMLVIVTVLNREILVNFVYIVS